MAATHRNAQRTPARDAPELYHGTPGFMNVAGGAFENYHLDKPGDPFMYDFTPKPSYVMTAGHKSEWGDFTGVQYVYSSGNGRISIYNPHSTSPYLCIDSSRYDQPFQHAVACP